MKPSSIFFPSQILTWQLQEPHLSYTLGFPANTNWLFNKGPYIVRTTSRKVYQIQLEVIVSDDENGVLFKMLWNWSKSPKNFKLKPNSILHSRNAPRSVSRISCLTTKDPKEQRISRFSVIKTACWDDVYANTIAWELDKLTICLKVCFKSKPGFHSTVSK